MADSSRLLSPLRVGRLPLQHRIVMAPLTRNRTNKDHIPLPLVAEYYGQKGFCYPHVPGIHNDAQVRAWREATDAVHSKGSYIFCQLWCLGRAADPGTAKSENIEIVGPSAVPLSGVPVREMTESEILDLINDYVNAAKRAIEAGFDGVEIHGANGYMVDTFIQDVTNKRSDAWGGTIEKRCRFACEVVDAVSKAIGSDRVGIRLSPWSSFNGMKMEKPVPQFSSLIKKLSGRGLAYLHLVEARIAGNLDVEGGVEETLDFAMDVWGDAAPLIIAGGFTPETARRAIDVTHQNRPNVAVAFGRYFISTPDLPFRIKENIAPNPYDRSTFYAAESPKGYTDYPYSDEWVARQRKPSKSSF
ncbi:hypothetical protein FB567DRAFT_570115 [Paraphoma chrysanthemicola]|uniref:NADH:flavin oxidoreductase/NADH oxidase N-terminal domain-containing protein n=1 Tax=Paraphoma chrysanthemicola TaxID=798071 RepID=A0A8K0VX11_9PLEO|nr:hypothetical protein FB567DRAFT_570115 [Paraphoma chrysanthemicola]